MHTSNNGVSLKSGLDVIQGHCTIISIIYDFLGLFQKLSSGGVSGNGGWIHNNVKFVLRDEDIQVWWG